jgi:putative FmdB family regulatory protein
MPLYEYQCENCGKVFELIQKFSDEPTAIHEQCGGKVHRLISAPALHFKGSGWYVTDYAKGGSNNSANGGKQEGEASSGGKDKDGASASKDSAASTSSSESSKSEGSKSEGPKSDSSKSDSSKTESPKPSSTPTTTTSSTSSDKK